MKDRVVYGLLIAVLAVLLIWLGGIPFKAAMLFILGWGSYEFSKCRKGEINWINYFLMVIFALLVNFTNNIDLFLIICFVLVLCVLAVFDERVSFEDACVTCLESIILSFGIKFAIMFEEFNIYLFGYVVIAAMLTDVFALFTGMLFGKHKLNERISPKKTIEGAVGGWLFGGLISFGFAALFSFFGQNAIFFAIASAILPIVSQIGDLTFSLIKRYYGIKDFSHLIPGHGGILDRFDSLLFTLLMLGALFTFL